VVSKYWIVIIVFLRNNYCSFLYYFSTSTDIDTSIYFECNKNGTTVLLLNLNTTEPNPFQGIKCTPTFLLFQAAQ
jgi:hypothetical protein